MTHRKFTLEWDKDYMFKNLPFKYDKRGKCINSVYNYKTKYMSPREWRLKILQRCIDRGVVYLNTLGGFANDRHIKWLNDRGFVKRGKTWSPNCCSGMPRYLSFETVIPTEKGKKYFDQYKIK